MFRSCRHASLVLPFLVIATFAAPKIEFDSKTFNCGNVIEGKTDKLEAVFILKNTGDSLLKLEKVKPGCGCTVVKYDSLIQPGKTAKIESQVNIKGHSSGPISKYITVTSNAKNEPSVQLTIEATVQAIIEVSENFLSLSPSIGKGSKIITLASKMAGLKVSNVLFKSSETTGSPEWQADIPFSVNYKFQPADTTRTDGYHVFKLEIFPPDTKKSVSGTIVIKTNHPDKPEISLQASIQK